MSQQPAMKVEMNPLVKTITVLFLIGFVWLLVLGVIKLTDEFPNPYWTWAVVGGLMGIPVCGIFLAFGTSGSTRAYIKKGGWLSGSCGLWNDLRCDPFYNPGDASKEGSIHGRWRGQEVESIYYGHEFRVEIVKLDAVLPSLEIAPREGLNDADRTDDLGLESAEFNDRFVVTTRDRAFAHAVLHPRMMERLLKADARRLKITLEHDVVFTARWAAFPTLRRLESRLDVLVDIANLIPAHVKTQYDMGQTGQAAVVSARRQRTTGKNWIAQVSRLLLLGILTAPLALVFAQWSLRAYRHGEATNGTLARSMRLASYFGIPLAIFCYAGFWICFH